jgi:hypothetical protein
VGRVRIVLLQILQGLLDVETGRTLENGLRQSSLRGVLELCQEFLGGVLDRARFFRGAGDEKNESRCGKCLEKAFHHFHFLLCFLSILFTELILELRSRSLLIFIHLESGVILFIFSYIGILSKSSRISSIVRSITSLTAFRKFSWVDALKHS